MLSKPTSGALAGTVTLPPSASAPSVTPPESTSGAKPSGMMAPPSLL